MKRIKRLVVPNGTYQKDGQEKTSWLTIGSMLKADDGRVKLKLDSMPVSDFDGWVNVFDLDDGPAGGASAPAAAAPKADEDLPF
jgi:hypothetical protein